MYGALADFVANADASEVATLLRVQRRLPPQMHTDQARAGRKHHC
jgi:hypothetical protein